MSTAESVPPDDLTGLLDAVWAMLAAAPGDPAAPLRTPVVATAAGGVADGRVMVLRTVDRATAVVTFFTDTRAAKVAAIAAAPAVAVVGYDPATRVQLRLRGTASLVAGGAADSAWAAVPPPARRAYRTVAAPGTAIATRAADLRDDDGRATFAVLTVAVTAIDRLDLTAPHRRAAWQRVGDAWPGTWRVP